MSVLHSAFPDIHFTIEDRFGIEDKLVVRWICHGTHKGEFMGIPPTGNEGSAKGVAIHRFHNGKIQESWIYWDALGFMQRLGVIPSQ